MACNVKFSLLLPTCSSLHSLMHTPDATLLLQVCAKLSAMTDELWKAGDPVLRSPTVHTVRSVAFFCTPSSDYTMLACIICL